MKHPGDRPSENQPEPIEPDLTRTEVRPGLTMIRRRTVKPDGRYLLYYQFERGPQNRRAGDRELGDEETGE